MIQAMYDYVKVRYLSRYLDEKGQGMVEYALILAFVVVIAGYLIGNDAIGEKIHTVFTNVGNKLEGK